MPRLYLSHQQYSRLLTQYANMTYLNSRTSGLITIDFDLWAIREYGLKMFTAYQIVVE